MYTYIYIYECIVFRNIFSKNYSKTWKNTLLCKIQAKCGHLLMGAIFLFKGRVMIILVFTGKSHIFVSFLWTWALIWLNTKSWGFKLRCRLKTSPQAAGSTKTWQHRLPVSPSVFCGSPSPFFLFLPHLFASVLTSASTSALWMHVTSPLLFVLSCPFFILSLVLFVPGLYRYSGSCLPLLCLQSCKVKSVLISVLMGFWA